MKTKNAMQMKAFIRNRAKAEGVPPQLIMQNYFLERLMECVALDVGMLHLWSVYVSRYPYVGTMQLNEACKTVVEIMESLGL